MKTRNVDVKIQSPDGTIIFHKNGFTVPEDWSDRAATIVANKYAMDSENSAIDIIHRVVTQISNWGIEQNYFDDSDRAGIFSNKLRDILINQRASFNSPVWFNCGSDSSTNQMSGCFIVPVEDNMESILEHNTTEGNIFKGGSGAGSNVSFIRGKGEKLSNKGLASGPIPFMKMWDSTAGVIKSGGKTRRSAKMICMDMDHPDILEFIKCKKEEEDKAKILMENGIEPDDAYGTVAFQNTNHSVRVSDQFMDSVLDETDDEENWFLINRGDKRKNLISSRYLFNETAKIAWATGDPGIQYSTRMNEDNPVPSLGKINSTNPCSEFCAVDNSSCNLASLNLVKYYNKENNSFLADEFKADIDVLITAMDILIDAADYPTEAIRNMTVSTRPLGLGFSNLGALLMLMGRPYDSEEAIITAKDITKVMTTRAYRQSNILANRLGPYKFYKENIEANYRIVNKLTEDNKLAKEIKEGSGLRNSQVTLLAPTGTISFMMDCDTQGIEPLFALKTLKAFSDGSTMEMTYPCVEQAAKNLLEEEYGCPSPSPKNIKQMIKNNPEIFKTANEISWTAHINMMAACQPHLNGAISKTINMPSTATVKDVEDAYFYGWKKDLKCIAIYRDGSKAMQPITDVNKKEIEPESIVADSMTPGITPSARLKPQQERSSITVKIDVAGHEGYVTAGTYPDGSLCEIFIRMSKEGSLVSGMMDAFATSISLGLQHGVPLSKLIEKFKNTKFDPQGYVNHESGEIHIVTSIIDYIFQWLELRFMDKEEIEEDTNYEEIEKSIEKDNSNRAFDGPECSNCGNITSKVGTCYLCGTCGTTSGCS